MNKIFTSTFLAIAVVSSIPNAHARLITTQSCMDLFQKLNLLKDSPLRKKIEFYVGSAYQKNDLHKFIKINFQIQLEYINNETILYKIQEYDNNGRPLNLVAGFVTRFHSFGTEPRETFKNQFVRIDFDNKIASNDRYFPRALATFFYTPNGRKPVSVRIAHKDIADDLDLMPTYN